MNNIIDESTIKSLIVPEQEITKYNHYYKKRLDEFYNLISQTCENNYQRYVFPNGRYANFFESHYEAQSKIQRKYGFNPSITDCLLLFGCIRVGYSNAQDSLVIYVETLYKPTKNAHNAILDYLYSQKTPRHINIDVFTNVLYGKYLKNILDKNLDNTIEILT